MEARSTLTGRIVDSYSNILTVKLFARARDEDEFVREALDAHTLLNGALLAGSAAMALSMERRPDSGRSCRNDAAARLAVEWSLLVRCAKRDLDLRGRRRGAGWHALHRRAAADAGPRSARALQVSKGEIAFENVSFGYGGRRAVLRNLDLTIRGGERIGLIGHSGAGKSTLVNLLLHFYDVSSGVIRIDGQDIAGVTQESLRGHIAMVTQDTSLLHRSIRDNIRYGRQDATEEENPRGGGGGARARVH